MPVADYKTYCRMIDHALKKKFAYPAINVTSLTTANGVLKGLADSKSDGIIQVSTGPSCTRCDPAEMAEKISQRQPQLVRKLKGYPDAVRTGG